MKKLVLADILGPERYAPVRDEMRRRIIETKQKRRVSVGPRVSLVFENRETMRFQIEEMCRAEGLNEPDKIQPEIDTYNAILPDDGSLAATLFVEVMSDAALRNVLETMVGLQNHVWLVIGGHKTRAAFEEGQFTNDKLAAVQYLSFPLDAASRAALATPGTDVRVMIDHENYAHEAKLPEVSRAELARDLEP
jgi:hypothetical protein